MQYSSERIAAKIGFALSPACFKDVWFVTRIVSILWN